jgi:hypothetical protein
MLTQRFVILRTQVKWTTESMSQRHTAGLGVEPYECPTTWATAGVFFNPRGSCKLRNGTSCVSGTMTNCNCQVKRKRQMPAWLPSTHARSQRQQTLKSLATGGREGHGRSALVQWWECKVYQTNRRDILESRKKVLGTPGQFFWKRDKWEP